MSGGVGDDHLGDSRGADLLLGGAGDDRFAFDVRSAPGSDAARGGPGRDTASFTCPSCRVSLNDRPDDGERGAARKDNLLQIENVVVISSRYDVVAEAFESFGRGDDALTGDRRTNVLGGRRGPDRITGGGGRDRLLGGRGRDFLLAADGERDLVDCGPGRDRAVVDRRDRVRGCERVRVRPRGA